MRKTVLAGIAVATMFASAGVASALPPLNLTPHHGASVTDGTWGYVRGPVDAIKADGNLVVTEPGCFYVKLIQGWAIGTRHSNKQCGPGTVKFHVETGSLSVSAQASICRDNDDDCGPSVVIGHPVE
ncbi:hypothetical protein [Allokutzneria oryzae]|uniref:Secreted protein n=1 Tax=Allokutzneria oryzae TaxID=1378989 RepID=A0ABV5ZP71_9PSEU